LNKFYTFAHLKRRINNEKNKQKCKNLVIIRLETDMNFKNLFLYKIFLVFFLFVEERKCEYHMKYCNSKYKKQNIYDSDDYDSDDYDSDDYDSDDYDSDGYDSDDYE
jgi:phosphopantothenoylcysteine synthetase/decarboxylase